MREILFRGKCGYNNEWVEGFYYQAKLYRSDKELCHYITIPHPESDGQPSDHIMVHPETVGQFTGLTDKNGKKIFEGDIIRVTYAVNGRKKVLLTGDVKFEDGAFFQYVYSNRRKTKGLLANFVNAVHTEDESTFCEVIGNIHDNPELLENP